MIQQQNRETDKQDLRETQGKIPKNCEIIFQTEKQVFSKLKQTNLDRLRQNAEQQKFYGKKGAFLKSQCVTFERQKRNDITMSDFVTGILV